MGHLKSFWTNCGTRGGTVRMEAAGIEPASTTAREERLQAYSGFEIRPAAAPGRATSRTSPSLMSRSAAEAFPLPASPLDDTGAPSRGLEGPARCLVPRRRVRDQIPHLRFPGDLRGHLEPRLATLPEDRPCRNQVAPGGSTSRMVPDLLGAGRGRGRGSRGAGVVVSMVQTFAVAVVGGLTGSAC